jgi:hypothetical protein
MSNRFFKALEINPLPVLLAGFLLFCSCDNLRGPSSGDAVAKVYDQYLYRADLVHLVPPFTSASDSIVMVQLYIDNWIRQQLIIREATRNTSRVKTDIEKKVKDYRNSLIVFAWENEQVINNLDTVISLKEVTSFYEQNIEMFRLKENIARVWFVKVPLDAPSGRSVIRGGDSEELEDYVLEHAANYLLDSDSWLFFDDLLRNVPLQVSSSEQFLRENQLVEITDDYFRYYMRIFDYKLKGSTSPMAFEMENLKNMILNRRKLMYVSQLRNRLYQQALENKNVETF